MIGNSSFKINFYEGLKFLVIFSNSKILNTRNLIHMITLSKLRLNDWYAFHLEMRRYTRQNLLKKGKLLTHTYIVYFIFEGDPHSPDFKPRYIGCTGSFYWRMVQHRRKITPQAKVYIKEFPTKAEALRYEKRCIKAWQPQLNIKYNTWWQYDLIG